MQKPIVKAFFDQGTWTFTYVVYEKPNTPCVVIDTVLNYDPKSGRTKTKSADEVIAFVKDQGLTVDWILETHAHADHLSAAPYIQKHLGGKIAIGSHIQDVQKVFKGIFNLESDFPTNGSQFDYLIEEGQDLYAGNLTIHPLFVPGHTPACMAYVIGDAIFVGDTIFMPDVGTARCDFPGGNANTLYQSMQKILSYPDDTRLFMCHDYPPTDRPIAYETTVGEEKHKNIHVHQGVTEAQFVEMRNQRDKTLEMPILILPSIQVNIRAGHPPPAETNGKTYLKIPFNVL
ncbi:MBL fold metallo-hydrolase [Polynucleobacter sp. HIN6]|uniref:MBL fold metallo-hydrolase n=1 Tax=unclassified Polynucleobacter TaxID=2640945 RepID=UPI002573F13F|nr:MULTISPECIES: MBL fold metallo-hydrolase [unclassified Polynucleobacter]BEI35112.1 MBL fold metallo-hydrolase [Polynucleobacter sp. HIN6]BEI40718.1 MBL fold metallo-hydrolase [Polynucleobacter sp. HIN9]